MPRELGRGRDGMQRKKVLVVEFDVRDAQMLAAALRRNGYAALVTGSGAEAIDLFRNEDPDLAVVNLLLPDMPAADVMRRFEGGARHLPVIAINQLAAGRSQLYQKLGADDQIAKPIDQAQFLRAVERLIGPGSSEPVAPPKRAATAAAVAPDKAEALPANGSLKSLPFHAVLAQVFRKRATGALEIRDEYGKTSVLFHDGLPISVHTTGLARRLVREGLLTEEEARRAHRHAADAQVTEEETLARMNLLLATELERISREFAADTLTELCRASEARFTWTSRQIAVNGPPFDPAVVVDRAMRRFFGPEKMRAALEAKGRQDRPFYLGDDPARLPDLANQPEMAAVVAAARAREILGGFLAAAGPSREKLERATYVLAMLKIVVFDADDAWPSRGEAAAPHAAPEMPVPTAIDEPPAVERPVAPPKKPEAVRVAPPPPAATPSPPLVDIDRPPEVRPAPEPEPEPEPPPPDDPLTDEQLLRMAEELLRDKTYSKAQRCAGEWLERCGDDRRVLLIYARAAAHNRFADPLNRLLDSVDALRRALALDARFTEARCELANILAEAGEVELAVAELETATAKDPLDAEAQRELRIMRRRLSRAE